MDTPTSPEFEPFVPRRYLRNRHAMTLAGNFLPRKNTLPPPEECIFRVDEAAQVLCHCHWQAQPERRAAIIIVHGLEGSSLSQYVIGNASKASGGGKSVGPTNTRT